MTQEISSLMDGELSSPEAERAIRACCTTPEAEWTLREVYAALPAGACNLTSVGADGEHTIYAASTDASGNAEAAKSFASIGGFVAGAALASAVTRDYRLELDEDVALANLLAFGELGGYQAKSQAWQEPIGTASGGLK